jgi:hypothetical protein
MPDLRFRVEGELFFRRNNNTLRLTDESFVHGTFQAGTYLRRLCQKHCAPKRRSCAPCPAFVRSHLIGKKDQDLASLELRPAPDFSLCGGFQHILEMPDTTPEERFILESYYRQRSSDERAWRVGLIEDWNAHWSKVESDLFLTRRDLFDRAMWASLRYPALIPQVWLNWLYATDQTNVLDENPSRVDFVAFAAGRRHAVEIDGPSHYASYDETTRSYTVDEQAYARNLKIARSLQRQRWHLTRIARIEVREAMPENELDMNGDINWNIGLRPIRLVNILPFGRDYPEKPQPESYGWEEIEAAVNAAATAEAMANDIPF